ncbi:DUF3871 family protein [Hymenobacter gelipurpurascens]|uniref:DUF3871 family protein n=1 Tax=Hymenobacter gelipurpurascens TaxID=89968 RepID=UPI0021CDBFFE|nr:DUF3871 family protein [Hymenobacter gelipurpurascens]
METSLIRLNAAPTLLHVLPEADPQESAFSVSSTSRAFIEANTTPTSFSEIRRDHIIPVFVKDNEPLISQADFIQVTAQAVRDVFRGEEILTPQIRVSHPIKGRTPDAKDKPAKDLQDWERTLYYERMMFAIEIPTMFDEIGGNRLTLIVGGVKAYNLDNLYNRKGAVEHFKLFVGFENRVCTNLCVRTDGLHGRPAREQRGAAPKGHLPAVACV